MELRGRSSSLFFFKDTATTQIYALSLHDALPIFGAIFFCSTRLGRQRRVNWRKNWNTDRKSTRLNSSHQVISYAVFGWQTKIRQARDPATPKDRALHDVHLGQPMHNRDLFSPKPQ